MKRNSMVTNTINSTIDCETQKGGRALLSGGCQSLSIRKEMKGWEFLAMLPPDLCSQS